MKLIKGDCLKELKKLPDNSVDSVVTDPPYNLTSINKRFSKKGSAKAKYGKDGSFQRLSKGFMGKSWDGTGITFKEELWKECLRVLKPGGHALICCGTRTYHRMATAVEDAGFEIRDIVAWVYGSGFPKSLNIGKQIDKDSGVEPLAKIPNKDGRFYGQVGSDYHLTPNQIIMPDCKNEWKGWGTALKPAMELWTLARKPLSEKTIARNVLKHGTGGINIDGCRVPCQQKAQPHKKRNPGTLAGGGRSEEEKYGKSKFPKGDYGESNFRNRERMADKNPSSRFPANFCHDGSDEVVGLFPETGISKKGSNKGTKKSMFGMLNKDTGNMGFGDSGSAARFFYCAKASKSERNKGLEGFEEQQTTGGGGGIGNYLDDVNSASGKYGSEKAPNKNNHPTVKPLKLMQYLCRLITPPEGTVLDPFMGSGTTGIACKLEGFNFIGIEKEEEYIKIAEARIKAWGNQKKLL